MLLPALASGATEEAASQYEEVDFFDGPAEFEEPVPPLADPPAEEPGVFATDSTAPHETPVVFVSADVPRAATFPLAPPSFVAPHTVPRPPAVEIASPGLVDVVLPSFPAPEVAPAAFAAPAPPTAGPLVLPELPVPAGPSDLPFLTIVPPPTGIFPPVPVPTHFIVETISNGHHQFTVVPMGGEGLVDVDRDATTGLAGIDIGVRVGPITPGADLGITGATVRIDGFGSPRVADLDVKIHVAVGDGAIYVGYLARDTIPALVALRAEVKTASSLAESTTSLVVNLTTAGAPRELDLQGGQYSGPTVDVGGHSILDPSVEMPTPVDLTGLVATFSPVPERLGVRLDLTDGPGSIATRALWESDASVNLRLILRDHQAGGARGNYTDILVRPMPTRAELTVRSFPETARTEIAYAASAKIPRFDLLSWSYGVQSPFSTYLGVSSLPRAVDFTLVGSTRIDVVASDAIGAITFRRANVAMPVIVDDGIVLHSVGTQSGVAVQLRGLREAHYAFLAPKHSIRYDMDGGQRFRFRATTDASVVDAYVSNLPAKLDLLSDFRYETDYSGSAVIRNLVANVTTSSSALRLELRDLPKTARVRTDLVGFVDYEASDRATLFDLRTTTTAPTASSLAITASGIPASLEVRFLLPSSVRYLADGVLTRLVVAATASAPAPMSLLATVDNLPPAVTLRLTDTGAEFTADGFVGRAAIDYRAGAAPPAYALSGDHAIYATAAGGTQIAAAVTDLRSFRYLGGGEEIEIEATVGGGLPLSFIYAPKGGLVSGLVRNLPAEIDLRADFRRHVSYHASAAIDRIEAAGTVGSLTFSASLDALPADLELWLAQERGAIRLATGEPIGRFEINLADPQGAAPPYTNVHLTVVELHSFNLLFTDDGLVDFRTSDPGRAIGRIEARLAKGAYRTLPGSHALVWDEPGAEAVSLRIVGLSVASADARGGALRVETASEAQRFDVLTRDARGNQTGLVVADLPSRVLVSSDLRSRHDYLASAPVKALWFNQTDAAGRNLAAHIRELPARVDVVTDIPAGDIVFDVSDPVGFVSVSLVTPVPFGGTPYDRAAITIERLPSLTLHVGSKLLDIRTRDVLESVGRIQAAVGAGALPAAIPGSHAIVLDEPAARGVRIDIRDFTAASVDRRGPGLVAYLRLGRAQDFGVVLRNATGASEILINPLPAELRFESDLLRHVSYRASHRILRLSVDTTYLGDSLTLVAEGVPAMIEADLDVAGGALHLDLDAPLDLLAVTARSGAGFGTSGFHDVTATLAALPSISMRWNAAFTEVTLRTHDPEAAIGLIDLAVSSGAIRRLPGDHAFVWSDANDNGASLRIHRVRTAVLDMTNGVAGELVRDPAFDLERIPASARTGAYLPPTIRVRIEDTKSIAELNVTSLPSRLVVVTDLKENHDYRASDAIFDASFASRDLVTGGFSSLRAFGIPERLFARVDTAGGRVDFDPSQPIAHVLVEVYEPGGFGATDFRRLRVDALTIPDLHVRWTAASDLVSFESAGTVGVVNASIGSGALTYYPRYMGDYVVIENRTLPGGESGIAARVSGVKGASFDTRGALMKVAFHTSYTHRLDFAVRETTSDLAGYVADLPRDITVTTDAASFATYTASDTIARVNVTASSRTPTGQPKASFSADIRGIPTLLDVRLDSSANVALLNASAAVQDISLRIWSAAGIGKTGFNSAEIHVASLPRSLAVAWTPGITQVMLMTGRDERIGLAEVRLTNKAAFRTGAETNYAFIVDHDGEKSVSVRIAGLRHAELTNVDAAIHALLRTDGGSLRAEVETATVSLRATQANLPADFSFDSNLKTFFHVKGAGGELRLSVCLNGPRWNACSASGPARPANVPAPTSIVLRVSNLPNALSATIAGATIDVTASETVQSLSLKIHYDVRPGDADDGLTDSKYRDLVVELTSLPKAVHISASNPSDIRVSAVGGFVNARFLMSRVAVQDYAVNHVVHIRMNAQGDLDGLLARVYGLRDARICTSCAPQEIRVDLQLGGSLYFKLDAPKEMRVWLDAVPQNIVIKLKTEGDHSRDHDRYLEYTADILGGPLRALAIKLDTQGQRIDLYDVKLIPTRLKISFPGIPGTEENGLLARCGAGGAAPTTTLNEVVIDASGTIEASMFELRFMSSDKITIVHVESIQILGNFTYFSVCIAPNEGLLIPDGYVQISKIDAPLNLRLWFGGLEPDGRPDWTFHAQSCGFRGTVDVDLTSLGYSITTISGRLAFFVYTAKTKGLWLFWC